MATVGEATIAAVGECDQAVHRFVILYRIFRNRLFSADPLLRGNQTSAPERFAFMLNFLPPYNLACWLWIKLAVSVGRRSDFVNGVSWWLMQRGLLFGALRHISPEDRNVFALSTVVPKLGRQRQSMAVGPPARAAADKIVRDGYVGLGPLLSTQDAAAAVAYFRRQKGYASQTPLQSDGVLQPFDEQAVRDAERYFCFSSRTSLACPQVAALTRHPMLREIAAAYLGFTPDLYSVNTIATTKGASDHYVMRMHRDYDAFACITFFVYWTDVAPDNGATIYLPRSHRTGGVDVAQQVFLSGGAGEVFAVDTFGLHSGNRNVADLRLTTWIRFGSIPNLGTIQDPDLVPVPQLA